MQTPDEIIHQPVRLKIMAALNTLSSGQWLEFVVLRSIVDTTDGNLGAHLATLEASDYVRIKKDFAGKKPRTRVNLSPKGREAFARYVAALHAILTPQNVAPEPSGS
ncbi:MAG TPA: transcriptional regulator [Pseudomonas xinjiangensis]|uniref:Transcriptional regulator n=2 Tax=root TaxID=1 RepID=A0A7V1BKI7_9GAMM|nr:transcriptional regulator [Halopseudomonas xinjiangensis]HEC46952.1 transcriptional regulator [Halopseudomonas xinjiangensis]